MELSSQDERQNREEMVCLRASTWGSTRVDGMANSGELLINVVRTNKPKTLRGLNQKVRGQVQGASLSPVVAVRATGEQAEPTPSVIQSVERGKPVVLPSGKARRKAVADGAAGRG